jgi:hypothetical protein
MTMPSRACRDAQAGSHAPLDSIAAELDAAKSRNDEQRARAEGMAADRMALEAAARQAEARVADLEAAAEARLATVPPGQRAAYQVGGGGGHRTNTTTLGTQLSWGCCSSD